ncbi:putative transcription factor & lipid binding HD-SAD family [Lupinus albus]|uniref:Putative transcription factor & lipid binding HD-SAD family n=1 Tax=Lupinus albus TaxID=3870 RepID=A0A6A4R6P0_LUPAL|nr:putative transcription factor & lipid binding HD-SAD family [Lupinus albus]
MEGSNDLSLLGENFGLGVVKDDDNESRSGSDNLDGVSGDDQDFGEETSRSQRRRKYHRHTPQQIQELETFFKECPHPDEKQRTELGHRLGLANKQVKFWFQNRRTQMKTQLERHENMMLRQENEKLLAENSLMKEAMANPVCQTCGGPALPGQISFDEHQVGIENGRLKDELTRICALANKFIGRALSPLVGPAALQSPNSGLDLAIGMNGFAGPSNHGMMSLPMGLDFGEGLLNNPPAMNGIIRSPPIGQTGNQIPNERAMLIEVAMVAMEELIKMAQLDSPLWLKSSDGRSEVLNHEEYARIMIPPCIGPKPNGYVTEATRESGLLIGNCLGLVEILMNADQWSEIFPSAVARAVTLEAVSTGVPGNRNGAIHVIHAEVQLPSPLVPVRQLTFIRYCKQHGEGLWAVVDVSVDIGQNSANFAHPIMNCRRLPSGCILQDTSNGLFKVTWVEHNQYDESAIHQLYRPLINSGIGYGAQRWIASLRRQFECLATLVPPPLPTEDPTGMTLAGKRNMVKLAQRITNKFFSGLCFSAAHQWEPLHFDVMDPNIKVMARKSVVGEPSGIVLSAATSVWMPISQQRLFDFLHDQRLRGEWDVLANNLPMQELLRISKGQVNGNCVSVLRNGPNGLESGMLVLQDAWTDNSSSVMVYVAVDMDSLNLVMSGGESTYLHLLPSGFIIHPDGRSNNGSGGGGGGGGSESGGSLLTFGLQILLSSLPNANNLSMESVVSVSNLITESIQKIKVALRVA